MKYYMELKMDAHDKKVDEERIIAVSDDGERIYGLHTSYPDMFTRLERRLPEGYLKKWCRVTNESEARRTMPELFAFLEKYGITDKGEGTYKEYQEKPETLPYFHEHGEHAEIPAGYGVDESHDGGWYPYKLDRQEGILYLTDESGLDRRCTSYDEALACLLQWRQVRRALAKSLQ